jgi:hypothetical protein
MTAQENNLQPTSRGTANGKKAGPVHTIKQEVFTVKAIWKRENAVL